MVAKKNFYSKNYNPKFKGYPNGVIADGLVFLSGMFGNDQNELEKNFDNIPSIGHDKKQGYFVADEREASVALDSWSVHYQLNELLKEIGADENQILRQHIWQTDKRYFPVYENIRQKLQSSPAPSSGLGISSFHENTNFTIGIDLIAVIPGSNNALSEREVLVDVYNKVLPSASFYAQAVTSGPLLFTAGHIAIKTSEEGKPLVSGFDDIPEEGRFLATGRSHPDSRDGPIIAQTWYVYKELERTLTDHGMSLEDSVNITVFLADTRDVSAFHRVHSHFFNDLLPALTIVGFDEVGHRGCLIEIEITAVSKKTELVKKANNYPNILPLKASESFQIGNFVFYSGIFDLSQIAKDNENIKIQANLNSFLAQFPEKNELIHQIINSLAQLGEALTNSGSSLDNLLKVTVYLAQKEDFRVFDTIFKTFVLDECLPALEAIVVPNPGPRPSSLFQIEAIGLIN